MRKHIVLFAFIVAVTSMLVSCGGKATTGSSAVVSNPVEEHTVRILIDYERNSFSYNDDAVIYIDDSEIGSISAGESNSFQITVEAGKHRIQAKGGTAIRHNNSLVIEFTIDETVKDVRFSLKDDSITGLTISLLDVSSVSDLNQSDIPKDEGTSINGDTTLSFDPTENGNLSSYEYMIYASELEIQELIAEEPIDKESLWNTYEGLLSLRMLEALFKDGAYGYYYPNAKDIYPPADAAYNEYLKIQDHMKQYFDEQEVDSSVQALIVRVVYPFTRTFSSSPYEHYEVLTLTGAPDIEAMWNLYFEELFLGSQEQGMYIDGSKPYEGPAASAPDPSAELFAQLNGKSFEFTSGVGGWGTELTFGPNGTFEGFHHDSEMGETGYGYPEGTVYICDFSGRFSDAVKVDDFTWSIHLKDINLDRTPGETKIEEGLRYVYSDPYGLDNGDLFYIYLPGRSTADLPERYMDCVYMACGWWDGSIPSSLPFWGLYNVGGEAGFFS